jgi:hypothetical protein
MSANAEIGCSHKFENECCFESEMDSHLFKCMLTTGILRLITPSSFEVPMIINSIRFKSNVPVAWSSDAGGEL